MVISIEDINSLGVDGVIDTVEVIAYTKPMEDDTKEILYHDIFKGDIKYIPITLKLNDEYYPPENEVHIYARLIVNGNPNGYIKIDKEKLC